MYSLVSIMRNAHEILRIKQDVFTTVDVIHRYGINVMYQNFAEDYAVINSQITSIVP